MAIAGSGLYGLSLEKQMRDLVDGGDVIPIRKGKGK